MLLRDANRLTELIPAIHEAAFDTSRWDEVIRGMENLIGTPKGVVMFEDRSSPEWSFVAGIRFDPTFNAQFLERREAEDFWLQGARRARAGTLVVGSDLIDPREMRKTAYYQDLGAPQNIDHMLLAVLASDERQHACISLLRGRDAGDFGGAETVILRALLPHFQAAYALYRHLRTRKETVAGNESIVGALIDGCDDGVVLIDHDGRIVVMNSVAEDILREHDGIASCAGHLRSMDRAADRTLGGLIFTTASKSGLHAGGCVRVDRPSGELPYLVSVRPVPPSRDELSLFANVSCVVIIEDPARTPERATAAWRELYRLTRSEARLCALLFDGKSLKQAADALYVSENTVRSHLKHVFEKCRVNSQAMLMQRLMKGRAVSN